MTGLRRVAFIIAFVLILPPFIVIAPATLICAGLAWLAGANEPKIDKILLNPVFTAVSDFPFKVLG